jgi:hypothetical protein
MASRHSTIFGAPGHYAGVNGARYRWPFRPGRRQTTPRPFLRRAPGCLRLTAAQKVCRPGAQPVLHGACPLAA